jgi:hypothetical protein
MVFIDIGTKVRSNYHWATNKNSPTLPLPAKPLKTAVKWT